MDEGTSERLEELLRRQEGLSNKEKRAVFRDFTAEMTPAEKHALSRAHFDHIRASHGQRFPILGITVKGDQVEAAGFGHRQLGPLAGASAMVTDGSRFSRVAGAAAGSALVGPPGLLVGLTTKSRATAFVIFADSTWHEQKLNGNRAVAEAQAECVRFNLLASQQAP